MLQSKGRKESDLTEWLNWTELKHLLSIISELGRTLTISSFTFPLLRWRNWGSKGVRDLPIVPEPEQGHTQVKTQPSIFATANMPPFLNGEKKQQQICWITIDYCVPSSIPSNSKCAYFYINIVKVWKVLNIYIESNFKLAKPTKQRS